MSQKPWRFATRIAAPMTQGRAAGKRTVVILKIGKVGAHTSGERNFH